jgi:spermidine dehydrogenase
MATKITRRDLLNGLAITTGGVVLNVYGAEPSTVLESIAAPMVTPDGGAPYYPPTLTGMRGSHDGSYEVAHGLAWQGQKPAQYQLLDEHYDLVIVGSGMSGLAAAWYYRQAKGENARILLLDNHDDFGGHAKRNEFHHEGRMLLGLAGAQNLDNPGNYSKTANALMNDIGIDQDAIDKMGENTPDDYLLGGQLHADVGMSLPGKDGHQTFGGHWLKFMHGRGNYAEAVRTLPIRKDEQDKLIHFFGGERDYLDDLSLAEKWDYVNSVSYNQFLLDRVELTRETIPLLDVHLLNLNGPSGWQHSVLEAIAAGAPGLRALGWISNIVDSIGAWYLDGATEIRMFPDGNASVARLIVQKLIPTVAPDLEGYENVAIARFDYSELDRDDHPTRIRLNSTAVGVKEVSNQVQVDYVQKGEALRVTADHCILACYNSLIPHLCPEMSDTQKEGLSYGVKVPFVYANVLLDNGQAFSKLGVNFTQCPHDPFQWVTAAPTVTNGGYEPPRGPDDPMLVFMMASPTPAAEEKDTARNLFRVGRHKIYSTTFAQYEQEIRNQLQSMLGQFGFDHERDIKAITVNRIPHGYAYWYQSLYDPEWEEGQSPHEIGRAQFGRISIANSDSEAKPYMDAAFDAAWRSVEEQT